MILPAPPDSARRLPRPLAERPPDELTDWAARSRLPSETMLARIEIAHAAALTFKLSPTLKLRGRSVLADYLRRCERFNWLHDYTQARPYKGLGLRPEVKWDTDCSGYAGDGFDWIRLVLGIPVVDPLGYHFSGYGWTGSIYDTNKRHPVPLDHLFMVGDLALYGDSPARTEHVVICRQKGDVDTSIWSSNGRMAAPEPVRLMYRGGQNLIGVYRPESLL